MTAPETRFAVLIFTDIVGSTELKTLHGVPAYRAALGVHNRHFEGLAAASPGFRILQNMGDGYFAEASGVAEAVRFALLFQQAMREGPWGEVALTTRVGIHAGEVTVLDSEGGSGIVAPAADLAARVMSLAVGGQILLTRLPFDEARHFIREHPAAAGQELPPLQWHAHGPYRIKGYEDPLEIFEVGAEGLAPLAPPPDGEKAKRAIRPGEEETVGWRPAVGLEIPGRPGWQLIELIGAGGFGEVWSGEHAKLRQRRAFKFCFDDERLRALKREVTLVRLLKSALGERDDIVRIHELKLDEPPFYLESDLAPHGNLLQWAERKGGLGEIPLAQRITLVAHTATALAAAHSLGVLHKDLKPTNILIFDGPDGEPRPRLVDFGIGMLADPAMLGLHGVTAAGFTRATIQHSTGTPTYSPPEYLAGRPYTIQGDIYGLGVLLYQLVTAKPLEPLAPGWERDVDDPLLREDIAACVDGDPARRLASAADLAERLETLEQRRAEIAEKEHLARAEVARIQAEAAAGAARQRASRMRRLAVGFALLGLLAVAGGFLAWTKQREADVACSRADREKDRATASLDREALAHRRAQGLRLSAESQILVDQDPTLALLLAIEGAERTPGRGAENALRKALESSRELRTLDGGTGAVNSAAFSPDGSRVVTGSVDWTATIWDPDTGAKMLSFDHHSGPVTWVGYSPDGQEILSASADRTAMIWNATTGKIRCVMHGHRDKINTAAWSPDGRLVATGSDDRDIRVWDSRTGELQRLVSGPDGVSCVKFAPGTSVMAVLYYINGPFHFIDASSGATLGKNRFTQRGIVFSADFTRDGRRLIDNCFSVASLKSGFAEFDLISCRDTGSDGEVSFDVADVRWNPDGTTAVASCDDHVCRIYNPATSSVTTRLVGHTYEVRSACFSPDGRRVLSCSGDGTARIWRSSPPIWSNHGRWSIEPCSLGPAGLTLASPVDGKGHFGIVDLDRDKVLTQLEGMTGKAVFDPTGKYLVAVDDNSGIAIYDPESGRKRADLAGSTRLLSESDLQIPRISLEPRPLRLSEMLILGERYIYMPPRPWLVRDRPLRPTNAGSREDMSTTLRVWSVETGQLVHSIKVEFADTNPNYLSNCRGCTISPWGTYVVCVFRNSLDILRVADGTIVHTITGRDMSNGAFSFAAFSQDERQLLASPAGTSGPLRLFDTETWREIPAPLQTERIGNGGPVAFGHIGRLLAATTSFGNCSDILVWDRLRGRKVFGLRERTGIQRLEFSQADTRLLAVTVQGELVVVDTANGEVVLRVEGVRDAGFSRDGRFVVLDHRRRAPSLIPVDPLAEAKVHAPRSLTTAEKLRFDLLGDSDRVLDLRNQKLSSEAKALVDRVRNESYLATEVVRRIQSMDGLDADLRSAALRDARVRGNLYPLEQKELENAWLVLVDRGSKPKAVSEVLAKAVIAENIYPCAASILLLKAAVFYRQGKLDEARSALAQRDKELDHHWDDSSVGHALLAMILAKQGDHAGARLALQRVNPTYNSESYELTDTMFTNLLAEAEEVVIEITGSWMRQSFETQRAKASFEKDLQGIMAGGNLERALQRIDTEITAHPRAIWLHERKFQFLLIAMNRPADAYKLCAELLEAAWDDPETLNSVAWLIVDDERVQERDHSIAMRAANRAVELTKSKDAAILDTLARVFFEQGDLASAVTWQAQAVDVSHGDNRKELRATLMRYENALASGGSTSNPGRTGR